MRSDEALKHVTVIGAAGKMGSGISLLLLQAMASQDLKNGGKGKYRLNLIDVNDHLLEALKGYLKDQLIRFAERNINSLREWYISNPEMVDNEQMVNEFVETALDHVHFGSSLELAKGSMLIFEAIIEDIQAKTHVLASLNKICDKNAYYFTNTSSIPIAVLAEKSHLDGRLIGYHFYNPPAVQKLLEIIIPKNADQALVMLATDLAHLMKKTVVFSQDIAGFIGNGYFIREIAFTLNKVKELTATMPLTEAIYLMNRVSQEYLVRPMGVFQLLDYVGIDVCHHIVKLMKAFIPDLSFDEDLINKMIKNKVLGGQYPDGSQKNGFFHYKNHVPDQIYDLEKDYVPLSTVKEKGDKMLGPLPEEYVSWKTLSKETEQQRERKLKVYFKHLFQENSLGAELAKEYLNESRKIAWGLVHAGVANRIEDVNLVLENGFFHLYGPENTLFPDREYIERAP